MLIAAYIGYAFFIFVIGAVVGTFIAAMRGLANPNFASVGFLGIMGLLVGVPCYFIAGYIRENGSEGVSLLVLWIAGSLGILIGLNNRA
jgi:hypothetical protein